MVDKTWRGRSGACLLEKVKKDKCGNVASNKNVFNTEKQALEFAVRHMTRRVCNEFLVSGSAEHAILKKHLRHERDWTTDPRKTLGLLNAAARFFHPQAHLACLVQRIQM